ncbi:puromycin-sensitive aminopeptidase-like [Brevipalpus obovatus]|uniref:puromycin-sensitive aminopeptidase-like n=1 Tax=Brevipalpus obovatus TaxID=246614 RepID=UPI003D9E44CC
MASVSVNIDQQYGRLPTMVAPSFYRITLKPDLTTFTFTGSECIHVVVKSSVNQIILNAYDMRIDEAIYTPTNSDKQFHGSTRIDRENQLVWIVFQQDLPPGPGTLFIKFKGQLNDQLKGFYRSKYTNSSGAERFSACTQFSPVYARKAFPCWDEPSMKARFQITIIAPKEMTVLSNTNVVSERELDDGLGRNSLKEVQFAVTPVMSTYIVGFVIGEYDFIEEKTPRGTRVRVYTPVGKKNLGKFALQTASKFLPLFEEYFGIPYPLEKLDHIGISDFIFKAMENWGLITYRETNFYVDPETSSPSMIQMTAMIMGHEIAHQWFGNLVTMEWWNDLWLKEGFATFMQYLATDRVYPEYDIWSQFVIQSSLSALRLDSFHNTHPIEVPVHHAGEIESIFDEISYKKGSAIIRMCFDWLGDEDFRRGVKNYLTRHSYKNAVTEDLWSAFEEVSRKSVGKMMSTWTQQRGYPIVTVSKRSESGKLILTIIQERFSLDGQLDEEEKKMLWQIPISVNTSKFPESPMISSLMTTKSIDIPLDDVSPSDLIKINPKMLGFYRVSYSPEMLEVFKSTIREKKIGPLDRLQLVDDLFATCLAGKTCIIEFLDFLSLYNDEDSYLTWLSIDESLKKLDHLLSFTKYRSLFNAYGRKFLARVSEKVGFDPLPLNKHTESWLRTLVLGCLVNFGDEKVVVEARKRFAEHCNGTLIPPVLREVVYRAIAIYGEDKDFEVLFRLYDQEELQEEKMRIICAAGAARDKQRIQKVLNIALSEKVRTQDSWIVILATANTVEGREMAWNFYKNNVVEIKRRYGTHRSSANLIEGLISGFASKEKRVEIEDFFFMHPFAGLESYVLRGLESIDNNFSWLSSLTNKLEEYLKNQV